MAEQLELLPANKQIPEDHGLSGTFAYFVWRGMHQRCYSATHPSYKYYGQRGIRICKEWHDFMRFLADMGHPEPGQSIGRINNDGHYEPSNCRWETQEQQNENTSRNRLVTYQGKTQILKLWAKEYNIAPNRLSERLRRGWSLEQALNTPCPKGYERGRAMHLAEAKKQWARNGRRYRGLAPARRACSKQRITDQQRAQVIRLRQQGHTYRAIAAQLGIGKSSITSILKVATNDDTN